MKHSDAEREAAAWLDTVGADTLATVGHHDTIVPAEDSHAPPSTGGARAIAKLSSLIDDPHQLKIGDVIGEGGMGVVRAAEQVALGRPVAVKTLKPNKERAALDLLREAWVTGALEHPNIVPVHALDLDAKGAPSIVMKKITGVEWSGVLGDAAEVQRRFGAKDLLAWNLEILMRVLDALRFAHSHGIIHRDLKPTNVMIGDFGEVYLLDWGIAVSLRDDGTGRFPLAKHATQIAGTPSYMAPEMLGREDGPPLSERTDVYLAGSMLYELIAGRAPHAGSNMLAAVASILASRPDIPASAPPELASICMRAMHEDPEQRFESAAALKRALQDYLEHRGSEQVAARATERLADLKQRIADPAAMPDDIYRLFGAVRYGFRDALAVWPANAAAARGLVDAVVTVAEHELAHGHAQAAVSLLGELEEPHPLLERARAEAVKEAERVADLELLNRQWDMKVGTRTRAVLSLGFGILFVAFPLLIAEMPALREASHATHVTWSVIALLLVVATTIWARHSVMASSVNRRMAATMHALFVFQTSIAIGGWVSGRPASETFLWNLFLYGMIAAMLTIAVDRVLWPATLVYIAAFVIASREPSWTLYLIAACNGFVTILAVWAWRPASIKRTAQERLEQQQWAERERERRRRAKR